MAQCYCDKECSTFGDCCLDKINKHKNWSTKESPLVCTSLSFNQSVFTVSNCDFGCRKCKKNCEKTVELDDYHYILDIPVFSNRSGLYYGNIYCAHCHHQLDAVRYPRVTIACTSNITIEKLTNIGVYQPGKLHWKVGKGHCSLYVHDESQKGRKCLRSITNCRMDSNADTKAKCRSYSYPVTVADKLYRNPHCAMCNGVKISDLQCDRAKKTEIFENQKIILDFKWKFERCNNTPEIVWDNIEDEDQENRLLYFAYMFIGVIGVLADAYVHVILHSTPKKCIEQTP
ncbi:unnamed protein product [Nezara viridula]|uniref:SMB domain-containing protein n=1 Tax=Nezara viridula TaxID=85310 RepID=A0A9P0MK86_NEZVI|nr:unnamed protein product [Nezara viridula]